MKDTLTFFTILILIVAGLGLGVAQWTSMKQEAFYEHAGEAYYRSQISVNDYIQKAIERVERPDDVCQGFINQMKPNIASLDTWRRDLAIKKIDELSNTGYCKMAK